MSAIKPSEIRYLARSVTEKCHPGAEVIFVPRVYLKHNCGDYL